MLKKTSPTQKIGDVAEETALGYLTKAGCKLIIRNFRCPFGEIDLIIRDAEMLAFVEVRYRGKEDFGSGAETVSFTKQGKIIRSAQRYLQQNRVSHLLPCRFDVVSMTLNADKKFEINWIKDAFQG
jgi:putative endonuclease